MSLKPKANATVCTATGLLFVSNIKRSPFPSRNSSLFPSSFSAQHTRQQKTHYLWKSFMIALGPTGSSAQAPFTTSGILPAWCTHIRCIKTSFFIVLLVSHHYCCNKELYFTQTIICWDMLKSEKSGLYLKEQWECKKSCSLAAPLIPGGRKQWKELKCPPSDNCSTSFSQAQIFSRRAAKIAGLV